MKVIEARNVHEALAMGLQLIDRVGQPRQSRNGPVLIGPPVATVYNFPCERVLFWEQRDANPFLHLYESLWMLAGRADIEPLVRYSAQFKEYGEDDGLMHGAYGRRWRKWFDFGDQLTIIADRLRRMPDDRRCVLQMWDAEEDLGANKKDVPCNTIATFQRDLNGRLDLHVFCRSNDIIWGAYGANAVHFSYLLEYMARWIGCEVGTYTQVSVNWHAYIATLTGVNGVRPDRGNFIPNPYTGINNRVNVVPMPQFEHLDASIQEILFHADTGFTHPTTTELANDWCSMVMCVLRSHAAWVLYKNHEPLERYLAALEVLHECYDPQADWIVAAREWMVRRAYKAGLAGRIHSALTAGFDGQGTF